MARATAITVTAIATTEPLHDPGRPRPYGGALSFVPALRFPGRERVNCQPFLPFSRKLPCPTLLA